MDSNNLNRTVVKIIYWILILGCLGAVIGYGYYTMNVKNRPEAAIEVDRTTDEEQLAELLQNMEASDPNLHDDLSTSEIDAILTQQEKAQEDDLTEAERQTIIQNNTEAEIQ